jgi:hypothetical protein
MNFCSNVDAQLQVRNRTKDNHNKNSLTLLRFRAPVLCVCSDSEFSRLVTVNAALLAQQPALRHAVPLAIDRAIQVRVRSCCGGVGFVVVVWTPVTNCSFQRKGNRWTGRRASGVDLDDHDARARDEGLRDRAERDAHAPRRSSHGTIVSSHTFVVSSCFDCFCRLCDCERFIR